MLVLNRIPEPKINEDHEALEDQDTWDEMTEMDAYYDYKNEQEYLGVD